MIMNSSTDNDVKKIYEKSVRLLNDKQARLMDMRQVLKKAVIRLSLASKSENEQVNAVLDEIKGSVDDHVDLDALSKHLDSLFILINHADYHAGSALHPQFYNCLDKALKQNSEIASSAELFSRLDGLIAAELPDNELSMALLNMFGDYQADKKRYIKSIKSFVNDLSTATEFKFDGEIESANVMQDLASELYLYINTIIDSKQNEHGDKANVNNVLTEMVNQLTLPASSKKDLDNFARLLSAPGESNDKWQSLTNKLVMLVNKSIGSIEQEKRELEDYLTKINAQLEDIESFMHEINRDKNEAKTRSLALTDSVETGVLGLEKSVSEATDLTELKQHVSASLQEIRKQVEEFKHVDVDQEKQSAQGYAKIMQELSRSQKESKKLKEQLQVSKIQLLRDPLTGISNRLAFDERVTLEYNRWKRHKSPFCMAIWDLDNFKSINDNYGHGVGDRVLKLFADIIQSRIRKVDMFARIGGEEFVLLMPDTPLDMALMLNEKLRVMLEECNFHYQGKHIRITSSVGLSDFQPGDEIITVLDKADKALYQSKDAGRNLCTVYEGDAAT